MDMGPENSSRLRGQDWGQRGAFEKRTSLWGWKGSRSRGGTWGCAEWLGSWPGAEPQRPAAR